MPFIALFLAGSLALALQASLFNYLQVGGVKPDLLLILIVWLALQRGRFQGSLLGLGLGLLEDLYLGRYLGSQALTKMLIGWLAGASQERFNRHNPLVFILLVLAATAVQFTLRYCLYSLAGPPYALLATVWRILLPELVYNVTLAVLGNLLRQEGVEFQAWLTERRKTPGREG